MKHGILMGVLAVSLTLVALPGIAQVAPCGDRDIIVGKLGTDHSESQRGLGLSADGRLVELFTSAQGGWTLLLTYPDGRTCVIGHGEHWQAIPIKNAGRVS